MRLVSTTDLKPGARLAEAVFGSTGLTLLHVGVELDREYIGLLLGRGVESVWIEDPDTADIEPPRTISPELRATVAAHLGESFSTMTAKAEGLRSAYVAVARKDMAASRFADAIRSAVGDAGLHHIANDMDGMLDELRGQHVLAGLNSIKSHDAYTFQHSIDVTIVGLILARSMNWERWRLKAFGIGCMLHDIGKLFIDPALLNKRGKLTPDEYEQVKAHPAVGYDTIKAMAGNVGVLAAHVAYQHHERQDGTGYPRRLRGSNALGSYGGERQIHDFGSIAAVADVYDAMTSARSYRPGCSPARALQAIRDHAGTHFNRAAVRLMLAAIPPYPVLSEIAVLTGRFAGWRGIVSTVCRSNLARPKIRLLFRPNGERVSPVELNLQVEADVQIAAAEPSPPASAAA